MDDEGTKEGTTLLGCPNVPIESLNLSNLYLNVWI